MDLAGIDPTTVIVIVFGTVAIAAFIIYQGWVKLRIKIGKAKLEIHGGNEPAGSRHDVDIQDVTSKKGRFDYEDETGDSLSAKKIRASGDVSVKRTSSGKEDPRPK